MLLVLLALPGCGSKHVATHDIAVAGGQHIARSDFQQYFDYTVRFYDWVDRGAPKIPKLRCRTESSNPTCSRLAKQVLRRLIEERVILTYAQQHHVVLRAADRAAIDHEVSTPAYGTGRIPLFSRLGVSRSFMRALLARELLVRRVEDAVAPVSSKIGPSLHLRKITIPISSATRRNVAYRQAVDLATEGRPLPPAADVRLQWVAPFRLPAAIRGAVEVAQTGQYTGPFSQPGAYLVVQLLGRSQHAYGTPARQALETRSFRSWVRARVRAAHPQCFTLPGAPTSCPG